MKWYESVLFGTACILIGGGIVYLTRPKEPTSSYYPTAISLTKAEPQPPVRQSPRQSSIPCEIICPGGCKKIIRGKIIRSNIEGDYCRIPPHEDCWYTGSDITL